MSSKHADASSAMDAYARGDDAAFERVYNDLAPELLRYLLRCTRDRAAAEDLLHQTFLQIHRARGDFRAGADVAPWAYAIARRLYLNGTRRERRVELREHLADERAPASDPESMWNAREIAERLDRELARLPSILRDTFLLVCEDGLSFEQAAQVLDASAATLRVRYHRARERLRAAIDDEEGGAS